MLTVKQQLELWQIEPRYAELRVTDRNRHHRLLASVASFGQQSPVWVVSHGQQRYVLIDGYGRLSVFRRMGHDTIDALILPMSETDALVFGHKQDKGRKRCSLEDGWLIQTLVEAHGLSLDELSCRLERSKSWVSRRLALVKDLPEAVQERVRMGKICAHAAMKYLVPLARANKGACVQLADGIDGQQLSSRQIGRLYVGWRKANKEERKRIVEQPLLFLKALDEVQSDQAEQGHPPETSEGVVHREIVLITGYCERLWRRIEQQELAPAMPCWSNKVLKVWHRLDQAFDALKQVMEERTHAGYGSTDCGDSAAPEGTRHSHHCPDTGDLPQERQAGVETGQRGSSQD